MAPTPAESSANKIPTQAPDETTPLINGVTSHESNSNGKDAPKPTTGNVDGSGQPAEPQEKPLPLLQILTLCYASLVEPIAYFTIFPFIPEMLNLTGGIAEKDIGFWSGLIESLFSLVQMVLMIFYGRAADRIGRKPVLVFSLAGVGVATAGFGMSKSLWQMLLFRCVAGTFAGSVVTIRTMLSEHTTKESQGRAFSWYMFARNLGIFLGSLIGGALANPAQQYPGAFGGVPFWEEYRYILPTFTAGALVLSAAIISLFILEETLERRPDGTGKSEDAMSTWEVLQAPGVPMVLFVFGYVMLLSLAYTGVSPVFLYTSVENGGFGFSDRWIAITICGAGASQAAWMLLAFPRLQKKYGTGTVLRATAVVEPLFFAQFPVMNEVRRHGWDVAFWSITPPALILFSGVSMAFTCIQLCINDISPSPAVLATINALSLTVNSGVRAFAPVLFTSIYAAGVNSGFADGHLVWFVLVPMALGLNGILYYLPEAAEGRPKPGPNPDNQEQE